MNERWPGLGPPDPGGPPLAGGCLSRSPLAAGGFMTVVETAYGKILGTEIADGVLAWRGIPYAAPPTGDLRLRPPRPPESWAGVREALDYGNRSLQPDLAEAPRV